MPASGQKGSLDDIAFDHPVSCRLPVIGDQPLNESAEPAATRKSPGNEPPPAALPLRLCAPPTRIHCRQRATWNGGEGRDSNPRHGCPCAASDAGALSRSATSPRVY